MDIQSTESKIPLWIVGVIAAIVIVAGTGAWWWFALRQPTSPTLSSSPTPQPLTAASPSPTLSPATTPTAVNNNVAQTATSLDQDLQDISSELNTIANINTADDTAPSL